MDRQTCIARNKAGQPCSRIPKAGALVCYKHDAGLDTLNDEELAALLGWHEELMILADVETPTPEQIERCRALWILSHAFEVLARQRAGLRSKCPVPCGLCGGLQEVFDEIDAEEAAAIRAVEQARTVAPDPDDVPEDPNDTSVEIL